MDIAEVLKRAKPPERTVELCLEADLTAEHDELTRQLLDMQRTPAATMAGTGKTAEVAHRIQDLEQRMRESLVTFRMRGISAFRRQEWLDAHPAREGKRELFDLSDEAAVPELIAACCVDPEMTVDQARELVQALGTGQTDLLFEAAWQATNGGGSVPFSAAASAALRVLEPKQS